MMGMKRVVFYILLFHHTNFCFTPEYLNYWVYFSDKGYESEVAINNALDSNLSEMDIHTILRRSKTRNDQLVDIRDLPVNEHYITSVLETGAEWRTTSKWLNAVSVRADFTQINEIKKLPFVDSLALVLKGKRIETIPLISTISNDFQRLEYGPSYNQLEQINVIAAHDSGYAGQGVRVLMLDTGYFTEHEAIPEEQIIAEWDFINNDGETQNEDGDPENQHNHGTYTLSTLGGRLEGQLYGPAYAAEFLLAKTEDVSQEEPIEEDWYVAGLEWGESMGADVASSSLGYIDWYTFSDLDGESAVTTIAVNIAVENGMVVCTAAGNSGEDGIIAPADAFNVITCGAVDSLGELTWFSSHGPTADGRIKPEVCARGLYTFCATPDEFNSYGALSGTSLSTPLIGGASAVILSAHPDWTPLQVREALMNTASQFENPDNYYGWGVIDVMEAINYVFPYGDVNFDGQADVLDIVLIVNYILEISEFDDEQVFQADINSDAVIDILDIIALINNILRS